LGELVYSAMLENYIRKFYTVLTTEGVDQALKKSVDLSLRKLGLSERLRIKLITNINTVQNEIKYDAPPDPYTILSINPNNIYTRNKSAGLHSGLGQIRDGEWDLGSESRRIDEEWYVIGIKQRFKNDYEWESTQYYKRIKKLLDKSEKKEIFGVGNIAELNNRCEYLDKLFYNIKSEGYKRANKTESNYKNDYRDELEILIHIDRNGEFQHYDGIHRLVIAQILDLNKVPAQVVCRHKQWQKYRDKIHDNEYLMDSNKSVQLHPDLKDILS